MLFQALLESAILLLVANLVFRSRKMPNRAYFGLLAFFLVGPTFVGLFFLRPSIVHFLQIGVLWVVLGTGLWRHWTARRFLGWSLAATFAVYVVALVEPIETEVRYAEYRNQYPFESMKERLPVPRFSLGSLLAETRHHLEQQEDDFLEYGSGIRSYMLAWIHNEHWDTFINSPAFGVRRRIRPSDYTLQSKPFSDEAVAQVGPPFPSLMSPAELEQKSAEADKRSLFGLHRTSFGLFANRDGFGFVEDRGRVAGFQPHGFRSFPDHITWKVQRVDLVGLILHSEPVVYLTDGLPRMDQAVRAPTRTPDVFESLGLLALIEGEDLFARRVPQGIRMLGALRSIKQCVKCHGGQRGDLLGAFSYCLVRAAPPGETR